MSRGLLCPEVVAQQPRTRATQQVACVLRDVQQPPTEYRESPGFARREQPRPRHLLVPLRRQLHPEQVSQFPETEELSIDCQQRSAIGSNDVLPLLATHLDRLGPFWS